MTAGGRRAALLAALHGANQPMSAGALAELCGVSRQVIVSDVALLRASGEAITATPRGYVLGGGEEGLMRTVACLHDASGTERELNIMVDNGCAVLDVTVEHPVYGQITAALDLRSRYDVAQFILRSANTAPLASLTEGIHLHRLLCPDEAAFTRVKRELDEAGLLLPEQE